LVQGFKGVGELRQLHVLVKEILHDRAHLEVAVLRIIKPSLGEREGSVKSLVILDAH